MTIRYSKKYFRTDLIVGSLYLIVGFAGMIFNSSSYNLVLSIFFFVAGFLYMNSFYYKQKYQYLRIKNGVLTSHLFGSRNRTVKLTEVTRIKKFTDEITFLTPYKKLKISMSIIAKEDLPAFKIVMASLELEPEKNPFRKEIIKTI